MIKETAHTRYRKKLVNIYFSTIEIKKMYEQLAKENNLTLPMYIRQVLEEKIK